MPKYPEAGFLAAGLGPLPGEAIIRVKCFLIWSVSEPACFLLLLWSPFALLLFTVAAVLLRCEQITRGLSASDKKRGLVKTQQG